MESQSSSTACSETYILLYVCVRTVMRYRDVHRRTLSFVYHSPSISPRLGNVCTFLFCFRRYVFTVPRIVPCVDLHTGGKLHPHLKIEATSARKLKGNLGYQMADASCRRPLRNWPLRWSGLAWSGLGWLGLEWPGVGWRGLG